MADSPIARVIFAGTPAFSVPTLSALIEHESVQVVAVYTQPDRRAGRGRKFVASPVKTCALQAHIPVYQPQSLRTQEAQQALADLQADLMVVVAYGLILPPAVLALPRLGCVNVHASLLPRWRGAAPIQRAVLAGDQETGITLMQMDVGLDTGPMLGQARIPISASNTSAELHDQLSQLGADFLSDKLSHILTQQIQAQKQEEALACYAEKIEKSEAQIDWTQSAQQIDRQIRAFNPWPVAQTRWHNTVLRIWQAQVLAPQKIDMFGDLTQVAAGTILATSAESIVVMTGDGVLQLTQLQMPGKKPVSAADFVNAQQTHSVHTSVALRGSILQ